MSFLLIIYLILLILALFFGITKISELTDRLVLYHSNENFLRRIYNIFRVYASLGIIAFAVMHYLLTSDLINSLFSISSLNQQNKIVITLFASSYLLFVTRIASLCPSNIYKDKCKYKERIASFNFSLIATLFFSSLIFIGVGVCFGVIPQINISPIIEPGFLAKIGAIWFVLLAFLSLVGEIILNLKEVPHSLKEFEI